MKKETWKYLKGSNKLYKISNLANFKSCIGKEKKLNVHLFPDKYMRVHLSLEKNHQSSPLVHVLVFENFGKEKRKDGYVIIHKNDNRRINERSNLKQIKKGEHMKDVWSRRKSNGNVFIKNKNDYFSTSEVASLYGCTRQYIIQLIWKKKIKAKKDENWYYQIHKNEVNRFLNSTFKFK